jgi:branched-chain amino acid transport system permease protein
MARKDYLILCFLTAAAAGIPLAMDNDYYLGILVFTALNCLTCVGLSLLMGYAGQISIGHAAFIGIGAYTSAILTVKAGWSPWTSMGAGVLLSIITAIGVGIPSLRLKGHYLAMATLGFGAIVEIIMVASTNLTGGPAGITGIPSLNVMGWPVDSDIRFYYLSWGVLILGLFFAINLIHSRIGRGLRAIHGSEDAAASTGVNTARYKIQVFIISAVYASISGSLYACFINYIDPGPFGVGHSVLLVTMVAVGGMHKIWGAILGAVLLSLLPEFLSSVSDYFAFVGIEYDTDYDMLIYGGILLSIMLFLPEGLMDGVGRAGRLLAGSFARIRGGRSHG